MNLKPHQQKEIAMRNEYRSSRGMIGLHAATSLPGDGNVQHDTVSDHMLLSVATECTHLEEPPATDSKAEVSDNGCSPPITYETLRDTTIVQIMEVDSYVHQEPTLASKTCVEPSVMAAVVPKTAEPSALRSILYSKGITNAYAVIDSESTPVPAQDVDNTMEQVTHLKETCLSSHLNRKF